MILELNYKSIGQRVKICRLKGELTQADVATKTGLTDQHISNIETGNTKVSLPALVSIANALSVSIDYFLSDSVVNSKNIMMEEATQIFGESNAYETRIYLDVLKATKKSIDDCVELQQLFQADQP